MKVQLTIEVPGDSVTVHELANQVQRDLSKTDDWFDAKVVDQRVVS